MLDNHPALQAIREEESEDENEQVQIFSDHDVLNDRLSKSLYYGRDTPSCDRLSLPITELCVDYFNLAGFDTTLTGQSDLEMTKSRLDRLDVARAAAVSRETCASPTSLVLALLYLERLRGSNPTYLHSVSSADLFLVSLLVASKLLHDDGEEDEVFNEEWATSAGMEKKDLNRLEIEFLTNIDWNCHVSTKQFEGMTDRLEKSVIQRQVNTRRGGWTTYTDINVLSRYIHLQIVWERLANIALKVTAVCLAAYAASLMTMLGTCYALTRANLGPTAVSQSLNTLKSAVTSSPRTIGSPSVQHKPNSSSGTEDPMPDLSNMDAVTLEQLASEESDTSSITEFITASINQNPQHNCQIDEDQGAFHFVCLRGHHKRKPPSDNQNMIRNPENHSTDNVLLKDIGSTNDTFLKDGSSYLESQSDDNYSGITLKDKKLCSSITSLRKFLASSMPWEIEHFPLFSPSNNYIDPCSSATCQNSWKNVLNNPFGMETNWFLRPPSIRQGLVDQVGKTMIGF